MRVPPRRHSSARTPMSLEFTRSMKACGKVFSRPTRSPTTFWSATVFLLCSKKLLGHQLPPGPVVPGAIPDIEIIGYGLGPQLRGELPGWSHADIFAARGQHNVLLPH